MTISPDELEKIAKLAYLNIDKENETQLTQDLSAIMNFMDQLRAVKTDGVTPLCHPFSSHQRLRADEITEHNNTAKLAEISPLFKDNLYLVPQVIESSK